MKFRFAAFALVGLVACSGEISPVDSELEIDPGSGPGAGGGGGGTPNEPDNPSVPSGPVSPACEGVSLPYDQPRRLNRTELTTIVGDVLGSPADSYSALPNDYGIRVGYSLGASERFMTDYFESSEAIASEYVDRVSPASGCADENMACARDILEPLVTRLWRRPVNSDALDELAQFTQNATSAGLTFNEGLKASLSAALMSPSFFIIGTDVESEPGVYPIDGFGIAERMALAIWNSVPDQTLIDAATDGSLDTPAGIRIQVERMFQDERGARFLPTFIEATFDLPSAGSVPIGLENYSGDPAALTADLRTEAVMLIEHLFENNLPIGELLSTSTTFVNERLATYYGFEGVNGEEFVEFNTSGTTRDAGLLTMGATLAQEVDLIHRGVNVLQTYLCQPLIAPDPEVVEEGLARIPSDATIRDEVEFRMTDAACASCHLAIDPAGASFEGFDAAGLERSQYDNGESVEYTNELFGETVTSPRDVADVLLGDRFVPCMSTGILGWTSFRTITLGSAIGRCASASLTADLGSAPGMRDLMVESFASDTFRFRVVQ